MNNNNDKKMCMCQEVIEYKINGLCWCGIKLFRKCTFNQKVMVVGNCAIKATATNKQRRKKMKINKTKWHSARHRKRKREQKAK